jgi:hypothetical protein
MSKHVAPLTITLSGVVAWRGARRARSGDRSPLTCARRRDGRNTVVAVAVHDPCWRPPPLARYRVAVAVADGGAHPDEVEPAAVGDALLAGRAPRDDRLLDAHSAARFRAPPATAPATVVEAAWVARLSARTRASPNWAATGGTVGHEVARQTGSLRYREQRERPPRCAASLAPCVACPGRRAVPPVARAPRGPGGAGRRPWRGSPS